MLITKQTTHLITEPFIPKTFPPAPIPKHPPILILPPFLIPHQNNPLPKIIIAKTQRIEIVFIANIEIEIKCDKEAVELAGEDVLVGGVHDGGWAL